MTFANAGSWDCHHAQSGTIISCTMQVREAYQRLPLGPDGSAAIDQLHAKMLQLQGKFARLDGQAVPRPEPSQYAAIEAEVDRFASSLGAMSRVTNLLDRLQQAKDQVRMPTVLSTRMVGWSFVRLMECRACTASGAPCNYDGQGASLDRRLQCSKVAQ